MKNNLTKTILLPQCTDFVGMGLVKVRNKTELSKTYTFNNLTPPQLFCDWRMLTGLFEFYLKCLPWYEEEVTQWRYKLKKITKWVNLYIRGGQISKIIVG